MSDTTREDRFQRHAVLSAGTEGLHMCLGCGKVYVLGPGYCDRCSRLEREYAAIEERRRMELWHRERELAPRVVLALEPYEPEPAAQSAFIDTLCRVLNDGSALVVVPALLLLLAMTTAGLMGLARYGIRAVIQAGLWLSR